MCLTALYGDSYMRSRMRLFTALIGLLLTLGTTGAWAQAREQGRLLMASQVLEELRSSRDQYIPDRLLERAYAIAVIPDMTKIEIGRASCRERVWSCVDAGARKENT